MLTQPTLLSPPRAARTGALVCPTCHQATLQRRHRSTLERVLARLMPPVLQLRRYACTHNGCGWQGLLRGHLPRRPGYLPQRWLEP